MYTTVTHPEVDDYKTRSPGQPLPEIFDHRQFTKRSRKEQLPYDTLKRHRDTLLDAENKYQKAIRKLEKEREDLIVTFEHTYQENTKLKSILEHGPAAAQLKKLSKDKKQQKGLIERLEEDNMQLGRRLKMLERMDNPAANDILEKDWKETLAKVRHIHEDEDAIRTQGPFNGGKLFKKKRIAVDNPHFDELDTYDLQLDTIQKETQVLLNKVKQLKQEKDRIDYSVLMGKGYLTRNAVLANAISEKLNRDLNKYAIRLEKLKLKHKGAKRYVNDVGVIAKANIRKLPQPLDISEATRENKLELPEIVSPNNTKRMRNKVNSSKKIQKGLLGENKTPSDQPNTQETSPVTANTVNTQARKKNSQTSELNWIPPKQFDKPGTYSKMHEHAIQYSVGNAANEVPHYASPIQAGNGKPLLSNTFRDDMRIQKEQYRIKTSSQGNNFMSQFPKTRAQAMRDTWVKNKDTPSNSGARYTNELEPIGRKHKANNARYLNLGSQKAKQTYSLSPPPIAQHSKYQRQDNASHNEVAGFLEKQSQEPNMSQNVLEHDKRQHSASPLPISFSTEGRYIHDTEPLMGNTGVRSKSEWRHN